MDSPHAPFVKRKAPPILIWRYLTEQKGIPAAEIAVYGDLKVDQRDFPLPADFRLFSGGDDDFAAFTAGNFRHIIFNQALQEGWDDPTCGFAYIDKSMASATQVEQVIGRALRQPGVQHYANPILNTAHFYIRTGSRQEFQTILDTVRRRISGETPDVRIDGYSDQRDRTRSRLEPKERRTVPEIHIDADAAVDQLADAVAGIHDYASDDVNTTGPGELSRAVQIVGERTPTQIETIRKDHSNRIVARWLVRRHMQSIYPEATKTIDWADPKFEVRIEITSVAATALREAAERLVDTYLDHSELSFEDANLYVVPSVLVKPDEVERFENALHDGYSDLQDNELEVARAIDTTGYMWSRSMPRSSGRTAGPPNGGGR
ncbi:hypothetical protein [Aureimonas sp. AU20]|uniref:hypothetical protein n=1 Tax=Aureimonas sp. AU20 TaxID=1349819 RepID=UPI0007221258|nr:hypothetical protein [Aureimonas sp. AU20]ALN73094.1 hypothetical protein M673_10205 [Aureimonas sp. AU20]